MSASVALVCPLSARSAISGVDAESEAMGMVNGALADKDAKQQRNTSNKCMRRGEDA